MQSYEITLILDALLDDNDLGNLVEKMKNFAIKEGAEIQSETAWGRRKLAYPIQKKSHGYYHVLYIQGTGKALNELNRQASYDPSIFKCFILKVENIEHAKSSFESLIENPLMNVNLYNQSLSREE